MDAVDSYIPDPVRDTRQALPYACRGRVHDHRPWYRCYRQSGARPDQDPGSRRDRRPQERTRPPSLPVSRCSESRSTSLRQAITQVSFFVVSSVRTSSAARFLPSPAPFTPHTEFDGQVYVLKKKRAAVRLRSSTAIVRSSTSERRTSPVPSSSLTAVRWQCPAIT